jgi:aminopeptidase-like protein
MEITGDILYRWVCDLFPVNRSLSGSGNLETLNYLSQIVPELQILEFKSGTRVFDWTIPDEWNINDAFIELENGERIARFSENNLHVVGYSHSIDEIVSKSELESHLHYLADMPNAIPYVTSYYNKTWGFCMTKWQYEALGDGPFRVYIDSTFRSASQGGRLHYGEIYIPGTTTQEILFSTYICHPSMANNELSGPVLATALANYLSSKDNHYSYRILFLPETIGAIAYLSQNLDTLKQNVIAGWVLTCLGDSGDFSHVASRNGNNYADFVTRMVLEKLGCSYKSYSWLNRGSDERQFCAPGIDLPVCSVTRSKYGTYPEYHTSLDNLTVVNADSLFESFVFLNSIISELESNRVPKVTVKCEPHLSSRGLYSNLSSLDTFTKKSEDILNIISYCDGSNIYESIARKCQISIDEVEEIIFILQNHGLIEE